MLLNLNSLTNGQQSLKDAKLGHLTKWMIVTDPALRQILTSVTGEDVKPITVKLRHFGKEDQLQVYDNMNVDDFIYQISLKVDKQAKLLSVKVVEDTVIRRIDRRVMNIDNPNIKNTLKNLKIIDNSALLVEEKSAEEQEDTDDVIKLAQMKSDDEQVDIDSTDNIRTVIVNLEQEPQNFERY